MRARRPLSVTVITRDEERNIGRCLDSVAWADEIVVVDSGSTDATVEIARRHGATVYQESWRGFTAQKNLAVDRATHPWILSLDADEWIGPDGADEIRSVLEAPECDAYAFDRLSAFSGAFLHRTWSPDLHVRLFHRERGKFEGGQVHESVRLAAGARVGRLSAPLYHLSYRSIADYVARMNRYTSLAAQTLAEQRRPHRLSRLILSPPGAFVKHYVLKSGWRDGVRGLVVSVGSAFYVFLKYAKLWEASVEPDAEFDRVVPRTPDDPEPGVRG